MLAQIICVFCPFHFNAEPSEKGINMGYSFFSLAH